MEIGTIIRTYIKEKGMTQEEMAARLGVSTPAVNKWEKGHSLPDVTFLAPIARLLGITTDELLSFRGELTEEEIDSYLQWMRQKLAVRDFSEVFADAKRKIEEYPNCDRLLFEGAMLLHSHLMFQEERRQREHMEMIRKWLTRCLASEQEAIRKKAAEILFYAAFEEKEYERAKGYLEYLSSDDPERKRREALICSRTGEREKACRAYEKLLLEGYQQLQLDLNDLRQLYMEEGSPEMVRMLVEVSSQLAGAFFMGRYNQIAVGLDVACWEKDVPVTGRIFREMVDSAGTLGDFVRSPLFRHLNLREVPEEQIRELRIDLMQLAEEPAFSYMEGDPDWEELRERMRREYGNDRA